MKGKKICPACSKEIGSRTRKCECGHIFLTAGKVLRPWEIAGLSRLARTTPQTPLVQPPQNPIETELPKSDVGYELNPDTNQPIARITNLDQQGHGTPLATVWANVSEVKTFAQTLAAGTSAFLQCRTSDKEAIILEIRPVTTRKLPYV